VASIIANPFINRPVIPHSVIAYRSPSISLTQSRSEEIPSCSSAHKHFQSCGNRGHAWSCGRGKSGGWCVEDGTSRMGSSWRQSDRGRLKTPMRVPWYSEPSYGQDKVTAMMLNGKYLRRNLHCIKDNIDGWGWIKAKIKRNGLH